MTHTKYSHLTNAELLRAVTDLRTKSPVIETLAERLEAELDKHRNATWSADCPVCEALLNCETNGEELELESA